jgi:hypothetical protein
MTPLFLAMVLPFSTETPYVADIFFFAPFFFAALFLFLPILRCRLLLLAGLELSAELLLRMLDALVRVFPYVLFRAT